MGKAAVLTDADRLTPKALEALSYTQEERITFIKKRRWIGYKAGGRRAGEPSGAIRRSQRTPDAVQVHHGTHERR